MEGRYSFRASVARDAIESAIRVQLRIDRILVARNECWQLPIHTFFSDTRAVAYPSSGRLAICRSGRRD
ncbi:hypothetical protein EMIT0P2_60121 [Pseudomonas sp. IT-P2]